MDDDVAPAPTAFLSHASEDKASFAEPLGRELASLGIRPWLDKWEIRPGDSLVKKLFDEGVAAVDAVIVVVSQYSAGKPWVRAELDAAMVRRITENTRLIPIRLDGADMPAPLRMLVWHDAVRTEDGIRQAGRRIADTIHGRDTRPAVAPPPAYTSAVRIPGLTAADSALLTLLAEEAVSVNNLFYVPWPIVVARAASQGLDEALALESLAVLEQRHYAKRAPLYAGGAVLAVELAPRGFQAVADTIVPGANNARHRIVASLVNTPSGSITVVDDLATLTGTPPLFVLQFLRELQAKGHLTVTLGSGGSSRITSISPALKRAVTFGTVVAPKQTAHKTPDGLMVTVDGHALFTINRTLYDRGEILAGQVHSHPTDAYHSSTDDHYPLVTLTGALSVVVPDFAAHAPDDIDHWAWYRLVATGTWAHLTRADRIELIGQ